MVRDPFCMGNAVKRSVCLAKNKDIECYLSKQNSKCSTYHQFVLCFLFVLKDCVVEVEQLFVGHTLHDVLSAGQ
jgi:hypothetical protein